MTIFACIICIPQACGEGKIVVPDIPVKTSVFFLTEQSVLGNAAHVNMTVPSQDIVQPRVTSTHDPAAGALSSGKPETVSVAGSIREDLIFWNEKLQWGLSPEQIDEYSASMETGVLKKYRTNPEYPHALFIPDERQYFREVGGALGFTPSESEEFVRTVYEYRRQVYETTHCPSWETCPPPKPIIMNFSAKPRPPGNSTGIATESPLQVIMHSWDDLLKKLAGLFQVP
jgi:hypothetical protein